MYACNRTTAASLGLELNGSLKIVAAKDHWDSSVAFRNPGTDNCQFDEYAAATVPECSGIIATTEITITSSIRPHQFFILAFILGVVTADSHPFRRSKISRGSMNKRTLLYPSVLVPLVTKSSYYWQDIKNNSPQSQIILNGPDIAAAKPSAYLQGLNNLTPLYISNTSKVNTEQLPEAMWELPNYDSIDIMPGLQQDHTQLPVYVRDPPISLKVRKIFSPEDFDEWPKLKRSKFWQKRRTTTTDIYDEDYTADSLEKTRLKNLKPNEPMEDLNKIPLPEKYSRDILKKYAMKAQNKRFENRPMYKYYKDFTVKPMRDYKSYKDFNNFESTGDRSQTKSTSFPLFFITSNYLRKTKNPEGFSTDAPVTAEYTYPVTEEIESPETVSTGAQFANEIPYTTQEVTKTTEFDISETLNRFLEDVKKLAQEYYMVKGIRDTEINKNLEDNKTNSIIIIARAGDENCTTDVNTECSTTPDGAAAGTNTTTIKPDGSESKNDTDKESNGNNENKDTSNTSKDINNGNKDANNGSNDSNKGSNNNNKGSNDTNKGTNKNEEKVASTSEGEGKDLPEVEGQITEIKAEPIGGENNPDDKSCPESKFSHLSKEALEKVETTTKKNVTCGKIHCHANSYTIYEEKLTTTKLKKSIGAWRKWHHPTLSPPLKPIARSNKRKNQKVKVELDEDVQEINLYLRRTRSLGAGDSMAQELQEVLKDVESIKSGKTISDSASIMSGECSVHGSWMSEMAGRFIDINPDMTAKLRKPICKNRLGFMGKMIWNVSYRKPFTSKKNYIILHAMQRKEKLFAIYMGECRICRQREIIQGQWLLTRHSRDCEGLGATEQLVGDVWRKDKIQETKRNRLQMLKKEHSEQSSEAPPDPFNEEPTQRTTTEK